MDESNGRSNEPVEEEDPELRSLRDAIRHEHDRNLAEEAQMALIRSDMAQFRQMFGEMNHRSTIEELINDSDGPARGASSGENASRPQRARQDAAAADAFYRKIRQEAGNAVSMPPGQASFSEPGGHEPQKTNQA